MKRFEFPLDRLLKLKRQLEQIAEQEPAEKCRRQGTRAQPDRACRQLSETLDGTTRLAVRRQHGAQIGDRAHDLQATVL